MRRIFEQLGLLGSMTVCLAACEGDLRPETDPTIGRESAALSVEQSRAQSCTTGSIKGLSDQIIEEGNCIAPGAYAAVPSRPNLNASSIVFLRMEQPARDALVSTLDAFPGSTMTVTSMLRTPAQQYLLYRWFQLGQCGIGLAARPGRSNHETGLAIDIAPYSPWISRLQARGFSWLGPVDPVHFDYVGPGAQGDKSLGVLAFQRLWNRNRPGDTIAEDGGWGPATEARMRMAPAGGFAKGASCSSTCTAVFDDICDSPFVADIEWLAAQGITSGCAQGRFCPADPVTRGQMAAFLSSALGLPGSNQDAFVDDDGSPFESAIDALAGAGITNGCSASPPRFCPDDVITREQMAAFLRAAFGP